MDERDGSENPFQRLFTKQLSQNLDVLCSILNRLFMAGRAWTILTPDLQLRVLEEEELSTALDHRANTSRETMMVDEPEVAAESIFLVDADRVEKLLDIIMNTVDMPNTPCIRQAAANEIAQIEHDLWEQMYPEQAAAEAAAEAERQKAEAERQKKVKEEQEKERKRQAKLREEEKEDAA